LVDISRTGFYYQPVPESEENLALLRRLDELPLEHPFYGSLRQTALLQREDRPVNRRRLVCLLVLMGVEVFYPKLTSEAYLEAVESVAVDVSLEGRGRCIENRFIERFWRGVKREDICVQDYAGALTAQWGLVRCFGEYNTARPR